MSSYQVVWCAGKKTSGQQGATNSGGGGGGGLSGVVYAWNDLPALATIGQPDITEPTPKKGKDEKFVVLCYALVAVPKSATQPFFLGSPNYQSKAFSQTTCTRPSNVTPLLAGRTLVIAVDTTGVPGLDRIEAVALNVAPQAGTPATTASVRGSMSPPTNVAVAEEVIEDKNPPAPPKPSGFFIKWPVALGGDTVPTVTLTALYRPPDTQTSVTETKVDLPPDPGAKKAEAGTPTPPSKTTDTTHTQPFPDQTITLLSLTLPQVHPLYYFNVTTGVVASSLRNPSFYRQQQPPVPADNGKAQYVTTQDNGDMQIFPVLLFSAYLRGFDAESGWNPRDLYPTITIGFSLVSPATNFFVGTTVEVARNIQLTGGLHIGKVTELVPSLYDDPTSSTAAATKQHFKTGAFFGATLNIDFIKGLFGGSKSS